MAATSSRWCQTEDDEGNSFTDDDIVNHMIFLMMAAHDTFTSTTTTMAYHLAAHPEWQDRARDESVRLGDGPLDIEALEKLETLDLVTSRCSHRPNKRHRYAFAPLVVGRTSALGWYSDSWRSRPSSTASCASTGLS
jgi:Cytochrome P450